MSTHQPLRRLTDEKLRAESSRRRMIVTASSVSGSLLTVAAATWINGSELGGLGTGLILGLFVANIALLLFLFRWMAEPAKERARRRRLSVLKMLGVEDSAKPEMPPVDTEVPFAN